MKSKILVTSLILSSICLSAEIDYRKCNSASGLYGLYINGEGELDLGTGYKLLNKNKIGNIEKYEIETNPNAFGMGGNLPPGKMEITLEKDSQGRITKLITGPDKYDKKDIEKMNELQLGFQVHNAVSSADWGFGNGGMGGGFGLPKNTIIQEPQYYIKNENGDFKYKTLKQLTKKERKEVGLVDDFYKILTSKVKRDKKSVERIRKGLKSIQDKSKPVHFLGSESEFSFKDGVCSPEKVSSRVYHTADESVKLNETFSKDNCSKIAMVHSKNKAIIGKCESATEILSKDIYEQKINLSGYMGAGGMGFGSYGFGFGMGGMSSVFGQIENQHSFCEGIFGESIVDITNPSEKQKSVKVKEE